MALINWNLGRLSPCSQAPCMAMGAAWVSDSCIGIDKRTALLFIFSSQSKWMWYMAAGILTPMSLSPYGRCCQRFAVTKVRPTLCLGKQLQYTAGEGWEGQAIHGRESLFLDSVWLQVFSQSPFLAAEGIETTSSSFTSSIVWAVYLAIPFSFKQTHTYHIYIYIQYL